ncbi:glycosyltransferase family 4 protein [Chitinimonas arctica]|uniref:Glycosyltransferase family 4 protein n=1 Tax=Chitinimonas arctica TaxID=2594795 RepID=A0A516SF72_9NEIS|nr:glycosyltransferase family 4 protein [Chitinimonas arctica]QDQ26793.1 glycosyltransferase family 4 protein [Chitinimonas arctica]
MSRPIRLAIIRQKYNPSGGAERFVSRAIAALAGAVEVTLLTRKWEDHAGYRSLTVNPFYFGSVWREWSFARGVCKSLAQADFDLVQSHERIACCDIYRAGDGVHREWLLQRRRQLGPFKRLGLWLNPQHHYALAAEKRLFNSPRLKAVICNSRMVKEELQRWFKLPDEKLAVIYSGIDAEQFQPDQAAVQREALRRQLGIGLDTAVLVYVGSGFERKGVACCLRALAESGSASHLVVVGHDKRAGRYRALAAQLGVAQRVHFVGAQKQVQDWYGMADALFLPTLYDPFPNVALEAFACGLPVLTSGKSGAAEFVHEGENGFVRDALDHRGFAELIAARPRADDWAGMRAAARATILPYSPAAMAERLTALYASLLENAKA